MRKLALLLLAACATTSKGPAIGGIVGTVADADSDVPVGEASVLITDGRGAFAGTAARADGSFEITAEPGVWSLVAEHAGYLASWTNELAVEGGRDQRVHVELHRGESTGEAIVPPLKLSGPDPAYTDQARENEVEGRLVVKCIITEEGMVRDCRVLRKLPYLDTAAVAAYEARRYRPAMFHGKPIQVEYTFTLDCRL